MPDKMIERLARDDGGCGVAAVNDRWRPRHMRVEVLPYWQWRGLRDMLMIWRRTRAMNFVRYKARHSETTP